MKKLVLLASAAAVAVTAALPAAALEMGPPRRAHDREPAQTVQASGDLALRLPAAGETSAPLDMNRFDTVRIAASANIEMNGDLRDVSGTVIHADKPIMVMGASRCSRIPIREEPARGRCDPLQEMLIPLDYWGERYVAVAEWLGPNTNRQCVPPPMRRRPRPRPRPQPDTRH